MVKPTVYKHGAATNYRVRSRVAGGGDKGYFFFSERFYQSIDPRFDYTMLLGCLMNHSSTNMNVVNSWAWNGFTKLGRQVGSMYIRDVYVQADEPSSEDAEYTSNNWAVTDVDHGIDYMPDLHNEGVFGYGSHRLFYDAVATTDFNLLEVWDGAALRDMNDRLMAATAWRHKSSRIEAPLHYHYDLLPVRKPLVFYHKTLSYSSPHSAYAGFKIVAEVRMMPPHSVKEVQK